MQTSWVLLFSGPYSQGYFKNSYLGLSSMWDFATCRKALWKAISFLNVVSKYGHHPPVPNILKKFEHADEGVEMGALMFYVCKTYWSRSCDILLLPIVKPLKLN